MAGLISINYHPLAIPELLFCCRRLSECADNGFTSGAICALGTVRACGVVRSPLAAGVDQQLRLTRYPATRKSRRMSCGESGTGIGGRVMRQRAMGWGDEHGAGRYADRGLFDQKLLR